MFKFTTHIDSGSLSEGVAAPTAASPFTLDSQNDVTLTQSAIAGAFLTLGALYIRERANNKELEKDVRAMEEELKETPKVIKVNVSDALKDILRKSARKAV